MTEQTGTTTGSGRAGDGPPGRRPQLDLAGLPQEVVDGYNLAALPLDRPNRSTSDLLRLDGKVAVVTGGGGAGLGDAICHRLAEAGAALAVLDANLDVATATATAVSQLWKVDALPLGGNVSDWTQAHEAVARVVDRFGTIDILVNNAGGSGAIGPGGQRLTGSAVFADSNRDDIDLIVAVNFVGVIYMTRAALEVMLPEGRGRIINIASEGGKVGMAGSVVYSASKTAVIGFTRNLAHEVGPHGVSIVAVCPGIMINERLLNLWAAEPAAGGALDYSFMRSTIGRAAIPDEIASAIAFLASDAGAYAHGTAISIGGGLSD
jgi:3-oxoacyl-[acyl-carrier protein] reductase